MGPTCQGGILELTSQIGQIRIFAGAMSQTWQYASICRKFDKWRSVPFWRLKLVEMRSVLPGGVNLVKTHKSFSLCLLCCLYFIWKLHFEPSRCLQLVRRPVCSVNVTNLTVRVMRSPFVAKGDKWRLVLFWRLKRVKRRSVLSGGVSLVKTHKLFSLCQTWWIAVSTVLTSSVSRRSTVSNLTVFFQRMNTFKKD